MKNCIGIISMNGIEDQFGLLCKSRSVYMLPFGGRYRLIDFSISNMVNHGISSIGVFTGEKIRSTMDHLGNGKPWNLNRRFGGLFLFPPLPSKYNYTELGNIADYHSAESFFDRSKESDVYIVKPTILAKVDLDDAYEKFVEGGYDVMFIYTRVDDSRREFLHVDKLNLTKGGEFINIGENLGTEESFNMYLGMMFVKKSVFMRLVREAVEQGLGRNFKAVATMKRNELKIGTYEFVGHWENIRDTLSYYRANLNLLKQEYFTEIFSRSGSVLTKTKDEPSAIYGESAHVSNSLIANGCMIDGDVENSVLFRGVKVGKNAVVKNSIIMQKTDIEDGAVVVNAIVDKYCTIDSNVSIAGSYNIPYIVGKKEHLRSEGK